MTEEKDVVTLEEEAEALGITKSRVSTVSFRHKKPEELVKETKRQEKRANDRLRLRIEAKKIRDKMKPIDVRKALLVGRFKAIRSRTRAHTYSEKNIIAWTEEYNLIINNPKAWNKLTNKGKKPFIPGNRKKMTARETLDAMDLE